MFMTFNLNYDPMVSYITHGHYHHIKIVVEIKYFQASNSILLRCSCGYIVVEGIIGLKTCV